MAWKDLLKSLHSSKLRESRDSVPSPLPLDPSVSGQPSPGAEVGGEAYPNPTAESRTAHHETRKLPATAAHDSPLSGETKRPPLPRADHQNTQYRKKSSRVEFVERQYAAYGDRVAAAVLAYALQSHGIQRLASRLGIDPWNNDAYDHEQILTFLRNQGPDAFCQILGLRQTPLPSTPSKTASPNPNPTPSGQAQPPSPPPGPRIPLSPSKPAGEKPTPNPAARFRPEGEHFQPVRIEKTAPRRLAAFGKLNPAPESLSRVTPDDFPAPPESSPGAIAPGSSSPSSNPTKGIQWAAAFRGQNQEPSLHDDDTQELHPPAAADSVSSPTRPQGDSPADSFLRNVLEETTLVFLTPRDAGKKNNNSTHD